MTARLSSAGPTRSVPAEDREADCTKPVGFEQSPMSTTKLAPNKTSHKRWWRSVLLSLFHIALLHVLLVLTTDLAELGLRRLLLRYFPTPTIPVASEAHPKGASLTPVLYGPGLARLVLNAILAIRAAYPAVSRPWIPIERIPPLYPLLPEYDIIVVGAGTAGSVLASRLAGLPGISVLLLEAGGGAIDGRLSSELLPVSSLLNQNTDHDWRFRTVPQDNACLGMPGRVSFWPRGKLLGGSAVFNFMIVHKGHPDDYRLWSLCLNDTMWSPASVGMAFSEIEKVYDTSLHDSDSSMTNAPFPRGRGGMFPITRKQPLGIIQQRFLDAVEELKLGNASQYNSGTHTVGGSPLELNKDPTLGTRVTSYRAFVEPLIAQREQQTSGRGSAASKETKSSSNRQRSFPLSIPESSVLHVIPFAHVTRVILRHESTSDSEVSAVAEGVEFAVVPPSLNHLPASDLELLPRQVVKAKREVVLSAGAIGTPHILLNSGIGPESELREVFSVPTGINETLLDGIQHTRQFVNLSAVGAHLMDHIFFPTVFAVRESLRSEILSYSNALTSKALWQYFGPFGGRGLLSSPGCDVQLMVAPTTSGPSSQPVNRAMPPVCQHLEGGADESLAAAVKQLYESLPELQILLYGGVPEIWDMHRTMNVALDTATRYGQAHHWNVNSRDLALFRSLKALPVEERMQALNDIGRKLNILLLLPVLLHPRSLGSLRLRSSNPFDKPLIDPRYLDSPEDVAAILRGIRLVEKVHATRPWRDVVDEFMSPNCPNHRRGIAPGDQEDRNRKVLWELRDLPQDQQDICQLVPYGSDAFWENFIRLFTLTLYHPAGTCRMGIPELDPGACVDSKLRVRGVRGLRVADASIFPTLPSGNTAFPVMMVATILARQLAVELGHIE